MGNRSTVFTLNALLACLGAITYVALCAAVTEQYGWVAFLVGMWPMIMFGLLAYQEKGWGRVLYVFNPRRQFWSFLFGDIAISLAFKVAAEGGRLNQPWVFHQWWWFAIVAPACGITGALVFHFKVNIWGYIDIGNATALDTPTFRLHAVMTWPVLFGGIVAVLFPYLWSWNSDTVRIVMCLSVWILGAALDPFRNSGPFKRWVGTDLMKVHLPTAEINAYHARRRRNRA